MSNYSQTTFFAPKDALLSGNPAKIIYGAQVDPELNAIAVAIATKYDSASIASGPILFAAGSAANPSISFTGGTNNNTGVYLAAANSLGFASNGLAAGSIDTHGRWTIPAPNATGQACFIVNGMANAYGMLIQSSTTAGQGFGLGVQAGTNSSDTALVVQNAAANTTLFQMFGDGECYINIAGNSAFVAAVPTGCTSVGYLDIPLNVQTSSYTLGFADRGKMVQFQTGSSLTCTIPANGTTGFPVGTVIQINNLSGNALAISTTDNLQWQPSLTNGNRSLAVGGIATLYKRAGTQWVIYGFGIT